MNWESIAALILIFVGYSYLLSASKKRSVSGLVRLHVESREKNDGVPIEMESFTKSCPFIVTPVPGMEFMPADIEYAVIKRVIIDEQGLLEVICLLEITTTDNEFLDTCKHLQIEGWHKKVYV